jgi:hypothetical protein
LFDVCGIDCRHAQVVQHGIASVLRHASRGPMLPCAGN